LEGVSGKKGQKALEITRREVLEGGGMGKPLDGKVWMGEDELCKWCILVGWA